MEEAVEPWKHINEPRKSHETPKVIHHLGSLSCGLQALLHPDRPESGDICKGLLECLPDYPDWRDIWSNPVCVITPLRCTYIYI